MLLESAERLNGWLLANEYKGYDPFDGLNARLLRPLTFGNPYLRIALQQGVRRLPFNIRPWVGVQKDYSSKGMGFLARGYLRLHSATGDEQYLEQARFCLDWLLANQAEGYSGAAWGNHFDYQSRVFYLPKGVPTVVWVALIGHAFLEAYDRLGDTVYLDTAESACDHIMNDLDTYQDGDDVCISYIPIDNKQVHNANTLGGSLLARVHSHRPDEAKLNLARKAINYTVKYQREDASWWYGEKSNLHWVDNFHTAYVLDTVKYYIEGSGEQDHLEALMRGYEYWKKTFFLDDGTPRYYSYKTMPIDIQCPSQAIDTLVYFNDLDPDSLELAQRVAKWTIENMQDSDGHFWFRRYDNGVINKTPTLHWGQGTMMAALGGLYEALVGKKADQRKVELS
jgi:rhamnogalacturonyl hydrolase YesR